MQMGHFCAAQSSRVPFHALNELQVYLVHYRVAEQLSTDSSAAWPDEQIAAPASLRGWQVRVWSFGLWLRQPRKDLCWLIQRSKQPWDLEPAAEGCLGCEAGGSESGGVSVVVPLQQ